MDGWIDGRDAPPTERVDRTLRVVVSSCARGDARDVIPGDRAMVSDDERFVSFGFARGRPAAAGEDGVTANGRGWDDGRCVGLVVAFDGGISSHRISTTVRERSIEEARTETNGMIKRRFDD